MEKCHRLEGCHDVVTGITACFGSSYRIEWAQILSGPVHTQRPRQVWHVSGNSSLQQAIASRRRAPKRGPNERKNAVYVRVCKTVCMLGTFFVVCVLVCINVCVCKPQQRILQHNAHIATASLCVQSWLLAAKRA